MIKSKSLKRFILALSIASITISMVGCSSSNDKKDEMAVSKIVESNFFSTE